MIILMMTAVLLAEAAASFGAEYYYGEATPGPMGKISSPKVTTKTISRTSIKLSWKAVKGAKGYVVYRGKYESPAIYSRRVRIYSGTKTSYIDRKCSKDTEYCYEVFAFKYQNGQKVYSQTSIVTVSSGVLKPYFGARPMESMDVMHLYAHSFGADKIVFYRSRTEGGDFEKIGELKQDEGSIADEDVSFGETYYYKARAYRRLNGKTYASSWSETAKVTVASPYLDIKVTDLNRAGEKQDTLTYKLTSDQYNYPATIYRQGESEFGKFDYSYYEEKTVGGSKWTSTVPVVLESYSLDGITYTTFPDTYILKPGASVYLRFKAADRATYYTDAMISLNINACQAGCIRVGSDGRNYYSYDY